MFPNDANQTLISHPVLEMEPAGKRAGEKWGLVEKGETIISIQYVRRESISNERKKLLKLKRDTETYGHRKIKDLNVSSKATRFEKEEAIQGTCRCSGFSAKDL